MKSTLTIAALCALALVGCGKNEVSFSTLEDARVTAKSNAEYNAQAFRASNATFANYAIEMQGDSTQTPSCPQGDGWASGKLVDKAEPSRRVPVKCSTVSGAVGCMTQADFEKKPFASDDGHCQPTTKVPHPLPKVSK
jgi:hypothetical protein